MSALALPKRYKLEPGKPANAMAKRIGIRFNGVERNDVQAYDVEKGFIEINGGETLMGKVEPYWR